MKGSSFTSVPFKQVDVFTALPFTGNPVAVVLDGNSLTRVSRRLASLAADAKDVRARTA
jgi:predicted PhzF superfamily epimerase YddE/YHI9